MNRESFAEHRTTVVLLFAVAGAAVGGLLVGLWIAGNQPSKEQVESVEVQQENLNDELDRTQKKMQGLRRTFLSTSAVAALPGPLTKRGAELRVLSAAGIAAMPPAQRHYVRGTPKGTGGAIRQNTYATCYLNASGTAQRCRMVVRRGTLPRVEVSFRVDRAGVHWLATRR